MVKTRSEEYTLFELAIDDVAEDLKFPMSMGAKAFVRIDSIFIDHTKVSPLFIARIVITDQGVWSV
jgi:hypothetical protein